MTQSFCRETQLQAESPSNTFRQSPPSLQIVFLLFTFLVASLLVHTPSALAQPAVPLHTAAQFIVDSNGKRIHLNAVNWYGSESTDFVVAGLQSASLTAIVTQIKSLGFNAVRLPWSNQLYETNPVVPNYALAANPSLQGQTALNILDQVISTLTSAGIMVILDNHNSDAEWCCGNDGDTLWYNTTYPESSWISDWQGIANRYLANPLVIGVDLRNEPRATATWGGDPSTDWHAASQRGANSVLAINPHLLVFVEGVNYALDLSGVATLPVELNVANQLVYSVHDYGFDYSSLGSYNDYLSQISPRWGYLVTGNNPAPLWLGEFGTCNSAATCIQSTSSADSGAWFGFLSTFIHANNLDWSYWAINGTESTGSGRTWGSPETYGILNSNWNASALPALNAALASISTPANGFTIFSATNISISSPGQSSSTPLAITPQNGFTATVSLTCALTSSPTNAVSPPTCSVPATVNVTATNPANPTITVNTTAFSATAASIPRSLKPLRAATLLACIALIGIPARRRRLPVQLIVVGILTLTAIGCGSGSSSSGGGGTTVQATTSGNYLFTVTATAPGVPAATALVGVAVQ